MSHSIMISIPSQRRESLAWPPHSIARQNPSTWSRKDWRNQKFKSPAGSKSCCSPIYLSHLYFHPTERSYHLGNRLQWKMAFKDLAKLQTSKNVNLSWYYMAEEIFDWGIRQTIDLTAYFDTFFSLWPLPRLHYVT